MFWSCRTIKSNNCWYSESDNRSLIFSNSLLMRIKLWILQKHHTPDLSCLDCCGNSHWAQLAAPTSNPHASRLSGYCYSGEWLEPPRTRTYSRSGGAPSRTRYHRGAPPIPLLGVRWRTASPIRSLPPNHSPCRRWRIFGRRVLPVGAHRSISTGRDWPAKWSQTKSRRSSARSPEHACIVVGGHSRNYGNRRHSSGSESPNYLIFLSSLWCLWIETFVAWSAGILCIVNSRGTQLNHEKAILDHGQVLTEIFKVIDIISFIGMFLLFMS